MITLMETEDNKSFYLSQRIIEFIENILIKDFALVSVFIIIMYLLTHISW